MSLMDALLTEKKAAFKKTRKILTGYLWTTALIFLIRKSVHCVVGNNKKMDAAILAMQRGATGYQMVMLFIRTSTVQLVTMQLWYNVLL